MPAGAIAAGMGQAWARIKAQHQYPDTDTRAWVRQGADNENDAGGEFFAEVSTRHSLEQAAPMNPKNRQGRVLFEIFVALAIVAALWAAIYVLLPRSL